MIEDGAAQALAAVRFDPPSSIFHPPFFCADPKMGAKPGSRRDIFIATPLQLKFRAIAWQYGLTIRGLAELVLGDEAHVRAVAQQHARERDGDEDLQDK